MSCRPSIIQGSHHGRSPVPEQTVLHKIAFQYYPLDLDASSNPFLVSWWPTALGDPALFHVSLQTACLDEELRAQKGFRTSELLMADSVALLRRKVQDSSLAVQDGTMNSVITLAAIEVSTFLLSAHDTSVAEMGPVLIFLHCSLERATSGLARCMSPARGD